MYQNAIKAFAAITASILMIGCTATEAEKPTHYWEGTQATTEKRYQTDDQACQGSSDIEDSAKIFAAGSDTFADYRACMIRKGYVLRTY